MLIRKPGTESASRFLPHSSRALQSRSIKPRRLHSWPSRFLGFYVSYYHGTHPLPIYAVTTSWHRFVWEQIPLSGFVTCPGPRRQLGPVRRHSSRRERARGRTEGPLSPHFHEYVNEMRPRRSVVLAGTTAIASSGVRPRAPRSSAARRAGIPAIVRTTASASPIPALRKSSWTTSTSRRNRRIMSKDSFTATSKSRPITSPSPSAAEIADDRRRGAAADDPVRPPPRPPSAGRSRPGSPRSSTVGRHVPDRHVDEVEPLDRALEPRRHVAANRSGAPAARAAPAAASPPRQPLHRDLGIAPVVEVEERMLDPHLGPPMRREGKPPLAAGSGPARPCGSVREKMIPSADAGLDDVAHRDRADRCACGRASRSDDRATPPDTPRSRRRDASSARAPRSPPTGSG